MQINKTLTYAILLGAALGLGTCTVSACSVTVETGEAGIKSTKYGANPGIQLEELPPGWHWEGFGETIRTYPTRQRTYSYTREKNKDGAENEEIGFSDSSGLPMTADVNLTLKVQENKAADLYAAWKEPFNDLLDGQVRNDVRSAIAAEAEKLPVQALLAGGRQAVIQRAFATVRAKWAPQGITVSQMEWVGNIRYPATVTAAIEAQTQARQQTIAAEAKVAMAKADADAKIETARGTAESTRLLAASISTNPEVVQLRAIEKWNGELPTYVGSGPMPFIDVRK
jgi:regulator of protease activity HflC (stomatin/prohibitin superfamily)